MKITRENQEQGNVILKVLVESTDYEKNVAEKLREYRQKASLPGFRPGKVPASLIQKRFARPILAEEVNNLLSKNLTEFMEKEKMTILGDPLPALGKQKTIDWTKDTEFEFVFEVALSPEIHIDFNKTDPFRYYKILVDDKMIDENVDSVLLRYGTNEETDTVGETSSVRGDFIQLDENRSPLESGIEVKSVLIAVDMMKDPETRKEILGKKSGDVLIFDPVRVFENRHEVGHMLNIGHEEAEKLNSFFRFTITSILNYKKAGLNQELYDKVYSAKAGITDEAGFRERIGKEIALSLMQSSDQKFHGDLKEDLLNSVRIDLPEPFLKRWLTEVNKDKAEAEIEQDFPHFLSDLRWQLIKNSIIRDYEIGVTEEEIAVFARQLAISRFRQYGIYDIPEDQITGYAGKLTEKEEDRERIIRQILEGKVVELAKEKGTIAEKEVTVDEFKSLAGIPAESEE